MVIDVDSRPKIESKSTLNSFELTMTCLEKSKLPLNHFGLAHFDQNNTDIEKVQNNKTIKNSKLIFHIDCFIGVLYLCILSNIATEIIVITHKDEHSDFAKYYKIVVKP